MTSPKDPTNTGSGELDDLVVQILAPYEYVAMAMLNGTPQHPLSVRPTAKAAYMKKHNAIKELLAAQDIESRISELKRLGGDDMLNFDCITDRKTVRNRLKALEEQRRNNYE